MTPNRPRAAKSGNDHSIPNNSHSGSTGNNRNPSLEKLKRKWKPYSQLTWQEKKELEDRDDLRSGTKASQGLPLVPNRRFLKRRAIRIQDFRPAAPKNTTQFLLEEHQGASPEVTVDVVSLEADESGDSLPGERYASFSYGFEKNYENSLYDGLKLKDKGQLLDHIRELHEEIENLRTQNHQLRRVRQSLNGPLIASPPKG
eukprot:Sdes_comp20170_c0_seq2m13342